MCWYLEVAFSCFNRQEIVKSWKWSEQKKICRAWNKSKSKTRTRSKKQQEQIKYGTKCNIKFSIFKMKYVDPDKFFCTQTEGISWKHNLSTNLNTKWHQWSKSKAPLKRNRAPINDAQSRHKWSTSRAQRKHQGTQEIIEIIWWSTREAQEKNNRHQWNTHEAPVKHQQLCQ